MDAQGGDHADDGLAFFVLPDIAHRQRGRGLLPFAHLLEAFGPDGPGVVLLPLPPDRADLGVAVKAQDLSADFRCIQFEQLDQRPHFEFLYV